MTTIEICTKLNELLDLYVQHQTENGYWHLSELKEAVRNLKEHTV